MPRREFDMASFVHKRYMQVCVMAKFSYPLKACGGFLVNYCAGLQEGKKRKACIILTGLACESL